MLKPKLKKQLLAIFIALLAVAGGYCVWQYANPHFPFCQTQYDEGYYLAFRMNSTGPSHICFKQEFWSMGKGFDDGLKDFEKVYRHPDANPFSYVPVDRLNEVIVHIRNSSSLEPERKRTILEQLESDLTDWESTDENESGG